MACPSTFADGVSSRRIVVFRGGKVLGVVEMGIALQDEAIGTQMTALVAVLVAILKWSPSRSWDRRSWGGCWCTATCPAHCG